MAASRGSARAVTRRPAAPKAAATAKRSGAAKNAALTRRRRAAGRKAAATRAARGRARTLPAPAPAPAVVPMLAYEDGLAALDWLARAFGFREIARLAGPDGRLAHGEMQAGEGLVMLASPTPEYESPRRHREVCAAARAWSALPWIIDGVLVYVDGLDAHFARAVAEGATILSGIEEGFPGRRYRAEDPEGHRWFFVERGEG